MSPKGERGAWTDYRSIQHLLSPSVETAINCALSWDCIRGTKYSMRAQVEADRGPWGSLHVEMNGNTHRPSEPTLAYFSTLGFVHRVCINGAHRPIQGTHEHRVTATGVVTREPKYMTMVPRQQSVRPGTWEMIFREFVTECGISLGPDFVWQQPWEGA